MEWKEVSPNWKEIDVLFFQMDMQGSQNSRGSQKIPVFNS
jgi:hypothetical protein